MQILTIKNLNFETPFRNPSIRTKVNFLRKIFFWISLQKNLVSRMLSHCENVLTSQCWRKSKEKKRNFFRKFTKGIQGFDLGKKKFKIISCLCTFKSREMTGRTQTLPRWLGEEGVKTTENKIHWRR